MPRSINDAARTSGGTLPGLSSINASITNDGDGTGKGRVHLDMVAAAVLVVGYLAVLVGWAVWP
jgi:hypothetical protein